MSDSAILSALSFWKEFDLESKRVTYDGHAAKIAENQEQSVPARTALVEETKKFGKQLTEEQGRVVKPIIKRYQQEIDRLTTRAKEAENSYLDMYKSIATLTDPSSALSTAAQLIAKAQRANQLEIENSKLSN
jgi:homeobox protein cut-like